MVFDPAAGIESFRSRVKPLLSAYPTLDVRAFACSRGDALYNVATTLHVSPEPFVRLRRGVVKAHPSFMIVRELVPSARLPKILDDLKNEHFFIDGKVIELSTPPRNPLPDGASKPSLTWHFSRDFGDPQLWDGRTPSAEPLKRYTLTTWSGEGDALISTEVLDALNTGLLGCRPRWLGFPDLVTRFLQPESTFTIHHNTTFSIYLPLLCDLQPPTIDAAGVLTVPVAAPILLSTRKLKVNALLTDAAGNSWSREATVSGPQQNPGSVLGLFTARLSARSASSTTVHLLLQNQVVDKESWDLWDPKSPNPRMAALRSLGQAFSQLEETLKDPQGRGRDSETFEIAVSNLFAACGFTTLNPGRKHAKAGETVDVVALHPMAPLAFCIECTWRVANNQGKLGKLYERTKDLGLALPGYTVRPILAVSKDEVTAVEKAEASTLGVIVLTVPLLRTMRSKAEHNAGPSVTAQWLIGNQRLKSSS